MPLGMHLLEAEEDIADSAVPLGQLDTELVRLHLFEEELFHDPSRLSVRFSTH